ncbi:MAG TPA: DNA mismatch repair protein MutS [Chitinophagales bacterium]|nr:DNA mismatch repair protein MutS [Chitinophagales bacterium]
MAKSKKPRQTPLMQQYNRIKSKHPDAILLFRVGDFYETFHTDAVKTANALGIVLTKRANGSASEIELAGFPYHALDTYLPKLVKSGYRVAICEQLEDPKKTKTIVKRGVTELITPGVAVNDKILDHKSNNFLASLYFDKKNIIGISFIDISTGEFLIAEGDDQYIDQLLQSFNPSEIVFAKQDQKRFKELFGNKHYIYALDNWIYQTDYLEEKLLLHFDVKTLKGFGVEDCPAGIYAAGAVLQYLADAEQKNLQHVHQVLRIEREEFVWLDRFTARNLELISSNHSDGVSLLDVMDFTVSPMGARMLKRWIVTPLKQIQVIQERLNAVEVMITQQDFSKQLIDKIKEIGDIERLISKVPLGKINPREMWQMHRALSTLPHIKTLCHQTEDESFKNYAEQIDLCTELNDRIAKTIHEEAPVLIQKGNTIRDGVNEELDRLKLLSKNSKDYLLELQRTESEKTGITSLKIGFNNVFGYYLEVRNTHKDRVPEGWIRKQTLTNAERYITAELKEYEETILGAEEKILQLEIEIFDALIKEVNNYLHPILHNAKIIAQLDCLQSMATLAVKNNYHKPNVSTNEVLEIKSGRHPVIEKQLPLGEQYIPNDVYLDNETQQIMIITGPNMAGKSALLRQTALIVLMAQMGSFVPAQSANIGLVDKVFTRVGASDNISQGESTFMVEMIETSSILNNISTKSLVLLDEIGRGTSTYDGISIAWALVEYLHNHPTAKAKTMFATHYHELNELAHQWPRVKNFNVSVKESGKKIIFLRKLEEGGSEHSFGIHVAKMAGMPQDVIKRANQILKELETQSLSNTTKDKLQSIQQPDYQLNIFSMDDPRLIQLKEILEEVDINSLTPVEALLKLDEMRKLL